MMLLSDNASASRSGAADEVQIGASGIYDIPLITLKLEMLGTLN